jgi:hypothetical protein
MLESVESDAYLEAERRIALARESGAEQLNLVNLPLDRIPDAIGELDQLRELSIWNGWEESPLADLWS